MRPGTTVSRLGPMVLVAAVAFIVASPIALAQTEPGPTPLAGASGTPYVAPVGTYVSPEEISPYLRPAPIGIQSVLGNATVVSVGASGNDAPPGGTVARSNVVTGWDFVGLTVMALGGVAGIGLLMGRRRSF